MPTIKGNSSAIDHMCGYGYDKEGKKLQKVEKPLPEALDLYALVTSANMGLFKKLLVRWVVYCQVAFIMLENKYFRELLACLNKGIANLLPRARATLRGWIMTEYEEQKQLVKEELSHAVSAVHLSFDLWSAPNGIAILSIYGHWIAAAGGKRVNKLLAFWRVIGQHSGEHQAAVVLAVMKEYEIEGRVGCIVGDNATSNDTAAASTLKVLHPHLKAKQRQSLRIRCFGHIVNLCAHALIFGKGKGSRHDQLAKAERQGNEEASAAVWRNIGAVRRLHNIVKYIR